MRWCKRKGKERKGEGTMGEGKGKMAREMAREVAKEGVGVLTCLYQKAQRVKLTLTLRSDAGKCNAGASFLKSSYF